MFCKWCGKKIENYSAICPFCHRDQDALVNGNEFWDLCRLEPNPRKISVERESNEIKQRKELPDGSDICKAEDKKEEPENIQEKKNEHISFGTEMKKKRKRNRLIFIIIGAVLFSVIIGTVVFLIFSNYNSGTENRNENPNAGAVSSTEISTSTPPNSHDTEASSNNASEQKHVSSPDTFDNKNYQQDTNENAERDVEDNSDAIPSDSGDNNDNDDASNEKNYKSSSEFGG